MVKKEVTFRCRHCNKEYSDWLAVYSCSCLNKSKWSSGRNRYKPVQKAWEKFVGK